LELFLPAFSLLQQHGAMDSVHEATHHQYLRIHQSWAPETKDMVVCFMGYFIIKADVILSKLVSMYISFIVETLSENSLIGT
jgi:hypothetical protein